MKHVIVGTAGHVDHGKTHLIKALTGMDTDRLKEEKQRGITIELGFTKLPNEEDLDIGIIDVPGHEKFVRHMLAGVGGIDLVLLVIAADEGIMPQTKEHLEILKMLHMKQGMIALTKVDLVEAEWLEMVKEDIEQAMKGTFLEQAQIIEVSSHTGQNITYLKEQICQMAKKCGGRREEKELLRIPVDRVFTIDGFGTVITGTLTEGSIFAGDEIMIYPGEKRAKVRNLQVHGKAVDIALAGQRTAVNLSGIKKEELRRGDVLAAPMSMSNTLMLDVRIDMFQETGRKLKNGSRLHLHYGSAETLCKAVLLDREELEQGQSGYAQLRLEEPIAVKRGDRFILRFYSPMESIGGGIVLDSYPEKRKRFHEQTLSSLKLKDQGSNKEVIEQILLEESRRMLTAAELAKKSGRLLNEVLEDLETLVLEKRAYLLEPGIFLHEDYMKLAGEKAKEILDSFHIKNPIKPGMEREEFRTRLKDALRLPDTKYMEPLTEVFIQRGLLISYGNLIKDSTFTVTYTKEQQNMRAAIDKQYKDAGCQFPEVDDVMGRYKNKELAKQIIDSLCADRTLVKLDYQNYIHSTVIAQALDLLKGAIEKQGRITLAEYRDLIGTSRKYAMMILEYADGQRITKKTGDVRILHQ